MYRQEFLQSRFPYVVLTPLTAANTNEKNTQTNLLSFIQNEKQSVQGCNDKCQITNRGISYDFDQKNYMFWKLVNSFKMMK
jgi:calcineurin-like phosphoesterase family protein